MALPYPLEVETGELRSLQPAPLVTFDVARAISENIVASGADVDVLGVRLEGGARVGAEALAERWRDTLTRRYQERVQAPREDTWQRFVDDVLPQLEHHTAADDSALAVLLLTVDNF